jgi:hypothetical protein
VKGEKMHRSERFYGAFEHLRPARGHRPKTIKAVEGRRHFGYIPKVEVTAKPVAISIQ